MEPYERLAEFCELTLRDVDLENKVLNIECQFQKTSDRRLIVESARTSAGTRKITMTDDVTRCFQGIIEDREPPHRRELNKNRDNKILPHLRQQMDEMSYPSATDSLKNSKTVAGNTLETIFYPKEFFEFG